MQSGISYKSAGKLENDKLYNKGSELQHEEWNDGSGLEWYDTHYRQLDPQIGRWNQIDPDVEEGQQSLSPYQSMADNPIRYNDPLGNVPGGGDEGLDRKGAITQSTSQMYGENWFTAAIHDATFNIFQFTGVNAMDNFIDDVFHAKSGKDVLQATASFATTLIESASLDGEPIGKIGAVGAEAKAVSKFETFVADGKEYKVGSYSDFKKAQLKDGHHIVQDAAVRDLPGYSTDKAPVVHLEGPAYKAGTEHNLATTAQRKGGGGTYGAELEVSKKALIAAGVPEPLANQIVQYANGYFEKLNVDAQTKTRIPGNRKNK